MNIQHNKDFAEGCLYVSINPDDKTLDFSGKYFFHSLYKNVGAYVRDGMASGMASSKQIFLIYSDGFWFISIDKETCCFLWGNSGGYFRLVSKGQYRFSWFQCGLKS